MGQKVIANEETEEDPIVNHILKVIRTRRRKVWDLELLFNPLSDSRDPDENIVSLRVNRRLFIVHPGGQPFTVDELMTTLATEGTRLWLSIDKLFTDNCKIRLVRRQPEHDQICIRPPDTMVSVGIVRWGVPLLSDVIDDLVFPFARD